MAFDVAEKYLDIPRMLDPEGKIKDLIHELVDRTKEKIYLKKDVSLPMVNDRKTGNKVGCSIINGFEISGKNDYNLLAGD